MQNIHDRHIASCTSSLDCTVDELITKFEGSTGEDRILACNELKRHYEAYVRQKEEKSKLQHKSQHYMDAWLKRYSEEHPHMLTGAELDKIIDAFLLSGDESLYKFLADSESLWFYPSDILVSAFEKTHNKYIAKLLVDSDVSLDYLLEHFSDFDEIYFDLCNTLICNDGMTFDQVDRMKVTPVEYAYLLDNANIPCPEHHDLLILIEQYHHGSAAESMNAAYELVCRFVTKDLEVQNVLSSDFLLDTDRDLRYCAHYFLVDYKKHIGVIQQSFEQYHDDFLFETIIRYSSQDYLEKQRDELARFAEDIGYYLACRKKIIEDKRMFDEVTPDRLDRECYHTLWLLSRYTTNELLEMIRTGLDNDLAIIRKAISERIKGYRHSEAFNSEDALTIIENILSSDDLTVRKILSGLFDEEISWDDDFGPVLLSAWNRHHDDFLSDIVSTHFPLETYEF